MSSPVPDVGGILLATAAFAALWWAAGWMLVHRLLGTSSRLTRLALTPVVGLGSLVVWNQLLQLSSLPVGPTALIVWLLASCALGLLVPRRRDDTQVNDTVARVYDGPPVSRPTLMALAGLGAITVVLWLSAMVGPRLVPDQSDNTRHGFFVARILETSSSDPAEVMVDDVRSGEPSATYYPLTAHASAAAIVELTALPIPIVLAGSLLASVVVVLLPGLVLLSRTLVADDVVALVAAGVGTLLLQFPADLVNWGAQPMLMSLAACPAAAAVTASWVRRSTEHRVGVVAAMCLVGVFGIHNTQIAVALAMAAAISVVRHQPPAPGCGRRVVAVLCGTGLLAPVELWNAASGLRERTNAIQFPRTPGALRFLDQQVTFGLERPIAPVLITCCAVAGGVLVWRSGRFGYAVALVVLLCLGAAASQSQHAAVRLLTLPWYGYPFRVGATAYLLAAPLVAWGAVSIMRRVPRPLVVTGLAVVAFTPQLAVLWLQGFQDRSAMGTDELAALQELAASHRQGMAVLTEAKDDGGLWLYVLHGVPTTFGFPVEFHEPGPQWSANIELLRIVADADADPAEVTELAQARCVEYVFAADHPNLLGPRTLSRPELRRATFLDEVFTRPTVSVFRINGIDAGRCGPETSLASGAPLAGSSDR